MNERAEAIKELRRHIRLNRLALQGVMAFSPKAIGQIRQAQFSLDEALGHLRSAIELEEEASDEGRES